MKSELFLIIILHSILSICLAYKDPFLTYPTNIDSIKKNLKTERPTIAILSLVVAGKQIIDRIPRAANSSYIAASFVRFVETAGGRVVPLRENLHDKEVDKILKSVNGAIIPGGDTALVDGGYERIAEKIYNFAIQQKRRGIIWPVLGNIKLKYIKVFYIYECGLQKQASDLIDHEILMLYESIILESFTKYIDDVKASCSVYV